MIETECIVCGDSMLFTTVGQTPDDFTCRYCKAKAESKVSSDKLRRELNIYFYIYVSVVVLMNVVGWIYF